jgi:hypothetical protein
MRRGSTLEKPFRHVVNSVFVHQRRPGGRGGGTFRHQLDCNHIHVRRASYGIPKRIHCKLCKDPA